MKLIVKNNLGETVSITIKSNETFNDLKERVEEEAGISLDLKDIAIKGKKITENQRVIEYFLSSNGTKEEEAPSNVFCAVPGCENTKRMNPDKVFFEFPTEEIRCHQWVLYCQRLNTGPGKKRLSLTSESTVCSDHFRPDQFVKNTNTLLKRTAVPCVKMLPPKDPRQAVSSLESVEFSRLSEFNDGSFFSEETEENPTSELHVRLCRLCASYCDDYILIFDDVGRDLKIAEKINLCLPIKVEITDGFPKQICKHCHAELEDLFEMADICSLAQTKLLYMAEEEMSNEDVVSANETDDDLVIGTPELDDIPGPIKGPCPLCKEGNMTIKKKKNEDDGPSSIFSEALKMDPLDLGGSGLKANCIEKNDLFCVSDYSNSISSEKLVVPLKGINKHSETNYYCKTMYDTSDLDSQLDSTSQDFNKENDPLKLDNYSKCDNEQISECYSSFTSPFNSINSGNSAIKAEANNTLSQIDENLQIEPDFNYLIDSDSDKSNPLPFVETTRSASRFKRSCRICANEFLSHDGLLKHSFSHSFYGFYQCSVCVMFYSTKEELEGHFLNHSAEESDPIFCDLCSKSFTSSLALASHLCKPIEPDEIKCEVCDKSFRSTIRLNIHMKCHESTLPYYCDSCGKLFPDEIKLRKHNIQAHCMKKVYSCDDCGKLFKSEASMKYHQRSHQNDTTHEVKPYTCEHCGKTFVRKSMLMNHITSSHKNHTRETPCFTCKLCYEAFPSTTAAVSHMDNHHKVECMEDSTYSFEMHTINRLFMCEFCERCYAEGTVLNNHREQHPPDSPYECKFCDTPFATGEEVEVHRKCHSHDEIPTEYLTEFIIAKTYLCEYCDRRFLNHVKYTEHLTVHYGPEPYQCQHCDYKCATLAEAMEHRASHGDIPLPTDGYNYYRPYECHYCNKTFAIEDALIKHIRMHTGEKPFICDQCGKGFSQSSGLYTHQKVHSSARPYSCNVCPRKFKIKGDRDVHVRKHSGDRPYKCEFCGKAFMTQHVYSQHRKIHTGERPYKCDVCGVSFRRSHVLTVHKRIHTGEKPNICDVCGKRYRQKGDMLKHKRVQHGLLSSHSAINILNSLPTIGS